MQCVLLGIQGRSEAAIMVDTNRIVKLEQDLEQQLNDIDEYITSQLVGAKIKTEPEDGKDGSALRTYEHPRPSSLLCDASCSREKPAKPLKGRTSH